MKERASGSWYLGVVKYGTCLLLPHFSLHPDTHVENDFVEELHRIAAEHQRYDMPVDLAPQLLEIDRLMVVVAVHVQELPRGIDGSEGASLVWRGVAGRDVERLAILAWSSWRIVHRGHVDVVMVSRAV